jgi:hypothetical protein
MRANSSANAKRPYQIVVGAAVQALDAVLVRALNADIRAWIKTWNDDPKPYVWTKTAGQILDSIARYCTRINDSGHQQVHRPHVRKGCHLAPPAIGSPLWSTSSGYQVLAFPASRSIGLAVGNADAEACDRDA